MLSWHKCWCGILAATHISVCRLMTAYTLLNVLLLMVASVVKHRSPRPNLSIFNPTAHFKCVQFLIRMHFRILDFICWSLLTSTVHPRSGKYRISSKSIRSQTFSALTYIFSGFPHSHIFRSIPIWKLILFRSLKAIIRPNRSRRSRDIGIWRDPP